MTKIQKSAVCLVCAIILGVPAADRLAAGTLVQFRTTFGDVEVELYDEDKPVTVQNFISYVHQGAYENGFSHRLIPGFVVQGGGYAITGRGTTNWQVTAVQENAPIANEFSVGRRFSNVYGTIAMAKLGGNTNSATSQWFFNLANNTFLDAADTNDLFVVFGHVIRGTNVLNIFNSFNDYTGTQTSNLVLHQFYAPPFDDLPLLYPNPNMDTNLLFIDVSLMQVSVSPQAGGGHQIAWNSPSGLTNVVEFTTNLPPVWTTLVQTNGTGRRVLVTDPSPDPARFYRVRVVY